MFSILLGIQILVSVGIITLVMLQHGKGADMGAGFGAGASGTVFGARGSGSFFSRATAILAAVFFINCLLIASPLVRHSGQAASAGIADQIEEQVQQQQDAAEQAAIADKLEQAQPEAEDLPPAVPGPAAAAADVPESPVAQTPAAQPQGEGDPAAKDDLPQ
ncbi:MAG: preprotein translocase subunit SecG [Pseudomonadota bacterium]